MFCPNCGGQGAEGSRFCQKCGTPLPQATMSGSPSSASSAPNINSNSTRGVMRDSHHAQHPSTGKRFASGKNPVTAVILSMLIIGVGQFYNGDVKKGIVMIISAIVAGSLSGGVLIFPVWLWSAFDAYQVASSKAAIW